MNIKRIIKTNKRHQEKMFSNATSDLSDPKKIHRSRNAPVFPSAGFVIIKNFATYFSHTFPHSGQFTTVTSSPAIMTMKIALRSPSPAQDMTSVVASLRLLHAKTMQALDCGESEVAEALFLKYLKFAVDHSDRNDGLHEDLGKDAIPRHYPTLIECPREQVIASDDFQVPETHFALYRCMFHLDEVPLVLPGSTPGEQLRIFAAVVAYNLGVLYHELAFCQYNYTMLTKAAWFYRKALGQIKKVAYLSPLASSLEVAAYNNTGQINAFLGDVTGILECREYLAMALQNQPHTAQMNFFRQSLNRALAYVPVVAPEA